LDEKENLMAELKTKLNDASVTDFLNTVKNEDQRKDGFEILKIMQQVTKQEPKMWGSSIIGFGNVHLKYASGRELDWFTLGFSPRKANLTVYLTGGLDAYADLLAKLGKHKIGGGCLYITKLKDVDIKIFKEILKQSVKASKI